jgi:catechol 2,3-dioxygenase-like lactoylglutathione lyase family enzyme
MDMKLEVAVIPVADVDRAKGFYTSIGWRLDADFVINPEFRIVQFTPPGSECSIIFGKGLTEVPSGGTDLLLVVTDIDAARAELLEKGVDVSDVLHGGGGVYNRADLAKSVPGRDPDRGSYSSYAYFNDPDGNNWLLQEITTRLPGR